MSWTDQLASSRQMGSVGQSDAVAGGGLGGFNQAQSTSDSSGHPGPGAPLENNAFALRKRVQIALALVEQRPDDPSTQRAMANSLAERQDFWLDTCRDVSRMHLASKEILDFYQRYGCRFCDPSRNEVQDILDALDAALSFWDRDHPELFYQTLELNFPELVRHG